MATRSDEPQPTPTYGTQDLTFDTQGVWVDAQGRRVPQPSGYGVDPFGDDTFNPVITTNYGKPPSYGPFAGKPIPQETGGFGSTITPGRKPHEETLDSLMQSSSENDIIMWQMALAQIGLLSGTYRVGAWDDKSQIAMEAAAAASLQNGQNIFDYVWGGLTQKQASGGATSDGAGGVDYSPRTTTQTRVDLSNRGTARGILTAALASELGRDPSHSEVSQFLHGLNSAQRNNPTVSTTTTDPSKGGDVSVSTTSSGGLDERAYADRVAKKVDPKESKRYQQGNYYGVIASMLGM